MALNVKGSHEVILQCQVGHGLDVSRLWIAELWIPLLL